MSQQKQITDPTNLKQIPQQLNLTQPAAPVKPITTQPIPPPTPKPAQPKPTEQKPIPNDIKIITDGLEAIEGIVYGMRQKLLQQYGPVDYSHIEEIEFCFPEDIAAKLSFERKDINTWIIKPKTFLGSDVFAQVAKIVKEIGGEYISDPQKKNSHFKVKRN